MASSAYVKVVFENVRVVAGREVNHSRSLSLAFAASAHPPSERAPVFVGTPERIELSRVWSPLIHGLNYMVRKGGRPQIVPVGAVPALVNCQHKSKSRGKSARSRRCRNEQTLAEVFEMASGVHGRDGDRRGGNGSHEPDRFPSEGVPAVPYRQS